jgi:AcrR family transcriptional regulator
VTVSRRERQAEQTRREIVAAARHLFAEQGYAKTSVAQIADAADVSVQTIYDSLGSKAAIVKALNDLIDDEGDVHALASRIPATDDPEALVSIAVSITRNINERCDDIATVLWSGASIEPELEAVRDEGLRRHREGIFGLAGRLESLGALRNGVARRHAADVIGAMTEPVVVRTFVKDYGWSYDQYDEWANDMLRTLVLKPTRGRRRARDPR